LALTSAWYWAAARDRRLSGDRIGHTAGMPGWIFVSILLAAATLLAAASGGPLELVAALAVITLLSALAGALRRAVGQAADAVDKARRWAGHAR
jgi:hypothetical protein